METENDKINEEIRKFIENTTKKNNLQPIIKLNEGKIKDNEINNLISVLNNLEKMYNKIHEALIVDDTNKLKKNIFETDVKASIVCESLLRVLRDVCVERNEYKENEKEFLNRIKSFKDEIDVLNDKIMNFEQKNVFISNGNEEMERIIKDQKDRIKSYKEKAENEKRNAEKLKILSEEMEISKKKLLDKNNIQEKEISVLNSRIKEKDEKILEFKKDSKIKENKEIEFKNKNTDLLKENENLKNKLLNKEKSLDVCNNELANLISKDKKISKEIQLLKDKSNYYERLYQSVNKQNEYLNEQLTKILNLKNTNAILDSANNSTLAETKTSEIKTTEYEENMSKMRKNIRKMKRRIKKYKSRCSSKIEENNILSNIQNHENLETQRMANEIKKLREENFRILEKNKIMSEQFIKKMEDLIEKNKNYQNKIFDFKTESISDFGNIKKDNMYFSNKFFEKPKNLENTYLDGFYDLDIDNEKKIDTFSDSKFTFDYFNMEEEKQSSDHLNYENIEFDTNKLINKSIPAIMKSRNEENITKMKGALSKDFFDDHTIHKMNEEKIREIGLPKQVDLKNENYDFKNVNKNVERFFTEEKEYNGKIEVQKEESEKNLSEINFNINDSNETSNESVKSVRTTSTLKEMIEKTEKMKQKFNEMDEKLNNIKNSNKELPEKIHNQIKEYTNYYYSDFLDVENDPDFL